MKKEYKNTVLYIKHIHAVKDYGMKLEYHIKFYDEESDPLLNKNAEKVYAKILSILKKDNKIIHVEESIEFKKGDGGYGCK